MPLIDSLSPHCFSFGNDCLQLFVGPALNFAQLFDCESVEISGRTMNEQLKLLISRKIETKRTFQVAYYRLYNNQMNASALIGQSAMVYCASKLMQISKIPRKSNV